METTEGDMRRALIIQHVEFEDLGNLAGVLSERGYQVAGIEASRDDFRAYDPYAADLVIALGGPIGVYDTDNYPFLVAEIDFLRARIEAARPTLGICLGAQLIVRALDANVYAGDTTEIGWGTLQLTEDGRQSPLGELGETEPVFHWHGDTFELPRGATLLASNENYAHQAFAVDNHCLALQFHPEVTASGLEPWYVGHTHELTATPGVSAASLRREAGRHADSLERRAIAMWQRWLDGLDH
ncbi:MAG: glutamine amidotransferase [Myxococcota bacterium]